MHLLVENKADINITDKVCLRFDLITILASLSLRNIVGVFATCSLVCKIVDISS